MTLEVTSVFAIKGNFCVIGALPLSMDFFAAQMVMGISRTEASSILDLAGLGRDSRGSPKRCSYWSRVSRKRATGKNCSRILSGESPSTLEQRATEIIRRSRRNNREGAHEESVASRLPVGVIALGAARLA
jgi:hypothetical protein